MNRKELVDAMAAKTGASKVDAERAVIALTEIISDTLKSGESLSLPGFGSFEVRERTARTARNPRTGEQVTVGKRYTPYFRMGKDLRERLNKGASQ